jgi:hypothetical protein
MDEREQSQHAHTENKNRAERGEQVMPFENQSVVP